MFFIEASEEFGDLAKQLTVDPKDLVYTKSFWQWSRSVGQNETSAALMRKYNLDEDKVCLKLLRNNLC